MEYYIHFCECFTSCLQVMDGYTVARTIRAVEKSLVQAGRHILPLTILAVSADSVESMPQCLGAGMQVFALLFLIMPTLFLKIFHILVEVIPMFCPGLYHKACSQVGVDATFAASC